MSSSPTIAKRVIIKRAMSNSRVMMMRCLFGSTPFRKEIKKGMFPIGSIRRKREKAIEKIVSISLKSYHVLLFFPPGFLAEEKRRRQMEFIKLFCSSVKRGKLRRQSLFFSKADFVQLADPVSKVSPSI